MGIKLSRQELNKLILEKYPPPPGQYCSQIVWHWTLDHVDGVEIEYKEKKN